MKVHNQSGSKERLFEMFGGVAKVKINEGVVSPAVKQILAVAFEKLKSGALKAEQGGSVEAKMLDNYVGINGYDRDRNMYNFNFKITGEEGDQDGVEMVNDVYLERFYYQNPRGIKVVELDENELKEFNDEHGADLFDAIEEYIDIQPKETPDDTVEVDMDENIEKKPDSDPFGGARQEYQDGMGYGDEKPVNPKLRVKAPELEKFVKEFEEEDDEIEIYGLPELPDERGAQKYAKQDMGQEDMISQDDIVSEVDIEVPKTKKPEGWKDVNGFFQDDGGVMKWTQKPEGEDATTLELPTGEPEDEVEIEAGVEEPSLDPEDADGDGDMIPGGKADDADIATYDPQQILKGMEIEMEHTNDPKVALEIAMDHLEEFGDYYTRLDSMEKEAEADLEGDGMAGVDSDEDGNPIPSVDPSFIMSPPEDAPEELKGHFDGIGDADKELEDAMLGFKTNTPNANKDEE